MKTLSGIICLFFLASTTLAQSSITLTLPNEESTEVARIFRELIAEFNVANSNAIALDVHDSWDKALGNFVGGVRQKKVAGILVAKNAETLDLQVSGLVSSASSILAAQGNFFDRFIPRYLAGVTRTDKQYYGVPLYCTVPVMYYNMDKLQAAGCKEGNFSEANLPKSWQELESLLLHLRGHSDNPPMLIGGDWYEWIFETMVLQNGGALTSGAEIVKFDSPEVVSTLKFWQKLWDTQLIDTTNSWKATINNFKYQNFPIVSYSSAAMQPLASEAKFRWSASAMPGNKAKAVSYCGASFFFSSNMTSEQKQLAAKFIAFLYKKEISTQIADATGLIAITGERMGAPQLPKESQQNAVRQIETAKPAFMTYQYDKMRKILKDAIARVFSGKMTVELSLARAQREAMHILAP